MKQCEVAPLLGVSPGTLSSLLVGQRRVGIIYAKKIAVYLGKPDSWREYVMIEPNDLRQVLNLTRENTTKARAKQ